MCYFFGFWVLIYLVLLRCVVFFWIWFLMLNLFCLIVLIIDFLEFVVMIMVWDKGCWFICVRDVVLFSIFLLIWFLLRMCMFLWVRVFVLLKMKWLIFVKCFRVLFDLIRILEWNRWLVVIICIVGVVKFNVYGYVMIKSVMVLRSVILRFVFKKKY